MQKIVSNMILYGNMDPDCILMQLADIYENYENGTQSKDVLRRRVYTEIKHILEVATDYGFNDNLWHNYLTYILITDENPFTLTCEKVGAGEGSVNGFAMNDFEAFRKLFDFDFKPLEEYLGIDCFTVLNNYKALSKNEMLYNKNVSAKVQKLSKQLENTNTTKEFFDVITEFYKDYGIGLFGLNKAFRIEEKDTGIEFRAISNMEVVHLDDLVGYEIQKKKLLENTEAFIAGKKANNCLLYGDSGTGKSTSIKAIINQYYDQGLRMVEIYKHQFKDLSNIIARLRNRNYKFIIYMDDLSFEDFEVEYKFLKAVIEGGVETKPENVLIYATSNRRHLIKETWADRDDVSMSQGIHKSDNMEEKLSLVHRFGVTIGYTKPMKKEFNVIVLELAHRNKIPMSDEEILKEANKWELSHGGMSGRTAQQFIVHLLGSIE